MVNKLLLIKDSFFRSIVFRLVIAVVLIMLLFSTLSSIITITKAKKNIVDTIQKQQLAFSRYISTSVDQEINKNLTFFSSLAREFSGKTIENMSLVTDRHIPPNFKHGVVVIASDGKSVISEFPIVPGRKKLSFVQKEWFQRAISADKAIISQPLINRITQEPSVVFAAPVKNTHNLVVAVVAGIVELKQQEIFQQLYNSRPEGKGDFLVISPKDKLFIASSRPEMVFTSTPEPGINRLHDMAMDGYRGVGITTNANGIEELSAIASLETTGWFVVVRVPTSEALMPVNKLSKSIIISNVYSITIVIFIIILALFVMLSPIKKSAQIVKSMASGKQPLGKLPVVSKDEVGDLIDGFNSLVDTINERTANLEEAKSDLEKRVEEIKQLSGLLPICAKCKKIRDDKGYWNNLESYLQEHSGMSFSHGICTECADELYGKEEWYNKDNNQTC